MEIQSILEKNENWEEILLGETLLFSLLSKLLYTVPYRDWLASLVQDGVFLESPFAAEQPDTIRGLAFLQQWGRAGDEGGITPEMHAEINADNTRLFIGIGKVLAPIWESVYFTKERLIFQESTLQVRSWYRRFGLEPENIYKEPDDHLALEIEFIAYLANQALQSLEAGEQEQCEKLLQAQRQFFSEHLLRWAYLWSQSVKMNAKTDFYRGLAYLVSGSVATLAQVLRLEIPEELAL